MDSSIELKAELHLCSERAIAQRLRLMINHYTIRSIAEATGHNAETTRRYLIGESKIPASFIASVAQHYELDLNEIIYGKESFQQSARRIPTGMLINELGRRMALIEDCVVASAATRH